MTAKIGFTLWLTGLSGAGKSTLSEQIVPALRKHGVEVELLDGDEVRTNLSKGLGFSKEDRDTNIRRIGYVARLLSRNGIGVISAAISPYRAVRREVKEAIENDGAVFIEIYVKAPLEVLIERDVKGLYKQAIAGKIKNFTGVSDPYEPPLSPDLIIETDRESVEDGVSKIIGMLKSRELIVQSHYSGPNHSKIYEDNRDLFG